MSFVEWVVTFLVSVVVIFGAGFLLTKIFKQLYEWLVPLKKREEWAAEIKRREDERRMRGIEEPIVTI